MNNYIHHTSWQREILNSIIACKLTIVEQDRCLGVSAGVMYSLMYKAMYKPGTRHIMIYPRYIMADRAMQSIVEMSRHLKVSFTTTRQRSIRFDNGSEIRFMSADDNKAHYHHGCTYSTVIVENADLIKRRVFEEVLYTLYQNTLNFVFTYTNFCPALIELETNPQSRDRVNKIMVLEHQCRDEFKRVTKVDFQPDPHMLGR